MTRWTSDRAGQEGRVLPQDLGLQLAQLRAGLDPNLIDQGGAQLLVGPQRFGLAFAPVQGQQPLVPEALSQRMSASQCFELAEGLLVTPCRQQRVDPCLLGVEVELLQPGPLGAGERSAVDVGQRDAAPQAQGRLQRRQRAMGVPADQRAWRPAATSPSKRRASSSPSSTCRR